VRQLIEMGKGLRSHFNVCLVTILWMCSCTS